jgi:hypothetical protein
MVMVRCFEEPSMPKTYVLKETSDLEICVITWLTLGRHREACGCGWYLDAYSIHILSKCTGKHHVYSTTSTHTGTSKLGYYFNNTVYVRISTDLLTTNNGITRDITYTYTYTTLSLFSQQVY